MSEKIKFGADEALHMVDWYPTAPITRAFHAGMAFAKLDTWGRMEQAIREYGLHNLSEVNLREIVLGGGK